MRGDDRRPARITPADGTVFSPSGYLCSAGESASACPRSDVARDPPVRQADPMRWIPYLGEALRVLGESPASALAFMEEIGAALPASGPPDPAQLAEIYRRHNSELAP